MDRKYFLILVKAATAFAFLVVLVGAFTRLTDAGLGCPDWPGCYGHLVVPNKTTAEVVYPDSPLYYAKAMTEMVHRYLASTLGLFIVAISFISVFMQKKIPQPKGLPRFLLLLVICQGLLGMWTVTLKLHPTIVMLHLLGGFTTLSCLWWLTLRTSTGSNKKYSYPKAFYFATAMTVIIAMQIALGGWTSSNYAALVCPSFPYCTPDNPMPLLDFQDAFTLWHPIGPNFEGGILEYAARATIQMAHRFGALITTLTILAFCIYAWTRSHNAKLIKLSRMLLAVLIVQVCLGISNIAFILPLPVAVLHNGVGALLLLTSLTVTFYSRQLIKEEPHVN